MIDYPAVLSVLFPDAVWSLSGDSYDGLVWHSDTPKPSQKTLDDAWPQVEYDRAYDQVRRERHAAYAAPDGPDAIFLQWQRGDATEQDWLASVETVKQAHPYPPKP